MPFLGKLLENMLHKNKKNYGAQKTGDPTQEGCQEGFPASWCWEQHWDNSHTARPRRDQFMLEQEEKELREREHQAKINNG